MQISSHNPAKMAVICVARRMLISLCVIRISKKARTAGYRRRCACCKDIHEGGTGSHVDSAKVLAEKIPGAELVLIEDGRHGYLREMPDKGHPPILDFLKRH